MTKNVFLDEWWKVRKPTGTAGEVEIRWGGGGAMFRGQKMLKMRSV